MLFLIAIFITEHHNLSNSSLNEKYCKEEEEVMGSLVANSSPFLFPCTIEYSLICAVILFEIWKHVKLQDLEEDNKKGTKTPTNNANQQRGADRVATHFHFSKFVLLYKLNNKLVFSVWIFRVLK